MFKNLTMWHEARKQERKIRDLIVDYKKRAERRRDFYEKIKADPTQFLQLHGRPVKIHLDPAVAIAGDSPANMMPWQGRQDVLIDRFDVRAHLDIIPEYPSRAEPQPPEELSREERLINYERYRIIVQNDFLGIEEEKFLHQLYLEEQFGPITRPDESTPPPGEKDGKKRRDKGAAIPYSYDGSTSQPAAPATVTQETATTTRAADAEKPEEEEEEDSDVDFDLCVDVSQIGPQQAHELNLCGAAYGMNGNDFFSFLNQDIEEKESLRLAREQEEEKAMYSVSDGFGRVAPVELYAASVGQQRRRDCERTLAALQVNVRISMSAWPEHCRALPSLRIASLLSWTTVGMLSRVRRYFGITNSGTGPVRREEKELEFCSSVGIHTRRDLCSVM